MNKWLMVNLFGDEYNTNLDFSECHNIIGKVEKDFGGTLSNITEDDLSNALNLIIAYLYVNRQYKIIVNIGERNKFLEPAKEMTLEEIEKKLGHKVKIVNGKEKEND